MEITKIAHISKTTQTAHRIESAIEVIHRAQIVERRVSQVVERRVDIHSRHVHEIHVHIVIGEGLIDIPLLFYVDIPSQQLVLIAHLGQQLLV